MGHPTPSQRLDGHSPPQFIPLSACSSTAAPARARGGARSGRASNGCGCALGPERAGHHTGSGRGRARALQAADTAATSASRERAPVRSSCRSVSPPHTRCTCESTKPCAPGVAPLGSLVHTFNRGGKGCWKRTWRMSNSCGAAAASSTNRQPGIRAFAPARRRRLPDQRAPAQRPARLPAPRPARRRPRLSRPRP